MSELRQKSGISFFLEMGIWVGMFNKDLKITLDGTGKNKCRLHDSRDDSIHQFKSIASAKSFAKRKRHGRTLESHNRAEFLQETRERMGWSVKTTAEKLGVSPRTVESWSSGARAVPKIVIIALEMSAK